MASCLTFCRSSVSRYPAIPCPPVPFASLCPYGPESAFFRRSRHSHVGGRRRRKVHVVELGVEGAHLLEQLAVHERAVVHGRDRGQVAAARAPPGRVAICVVRDMSRSTRYSMLYGVCVEFDEVFRVIRGCYEADGGRCAVTLKP
ncbi:hypothetical protein EVAR_54561_1 [Eumeta japonica]|uniref:Uncharacterized protein n=1 Tax=Eumeta variegata TaxID=151549 RepID=A0A4C1YDU8_EUMVA|nr:hypothetical protein EVAR_54561_1 [Eumeta japonica]